MKQLKKPASILIADDDSMFREFLSDALQAEGYFITQYDPETSDPDLLKKKYDVAIVDLIMPKTDGFEICQEIQKHSSGTQFIIVTGQPDTQKLDRAMNLGVYTFLIKPFTPIHIRYAVIGALKVREIFLQNITYRAILESESMGIIGNSQHTQSVRARVAELAPLDIPVMLSGESGTGKEVVARCIHENSRRAGNKMIAINCASLSPGLIESELFGHAKGAFTGATGTKHGFFEAADNGTLFLDEIGDFPLALQSKLLRILDNGEFSRVGETELRHVDVRIISATNADLETLVKENRFRKDLYYRLKGVQIHLLPLRERLEDIPLLVYYFLGNEEMVVLPYAMDMLKEYEWPGNARELKMVVENLKGFAFKKIITGESVARVIGIHETFSKQAETLTYHDFKGKIIRDQEKAYFESLLETSHGNISQAARMANMARKHLYDKLNNLGVRSGR